MRILVFTALLCLWFAFGLIAADEQSAELTAADVSAFLDGFVPMQIEREDIAGAVVVVVKDGTVLFAKGYGFADAKNRKPVSAENTLFRPGSISKLFTWTSVMQLVEKGKLDLDRDVNTYLDFRIPSYDSRPITLRNIMTHTSGFEETVKELFAEDPTHMPALDTYLKAHVPDRIFPPGRTPAYSNYATAVAGYIVSRIAGKPFNQYVEETIFKPLGMMHSTFTQPLPANLKPLMSNGYNRGSDDPKPFEVITCYPAGSLSTTASDMARFMIAHLQNGKYGDARILSDETARLMHSRQFGPDDAEPGMALGFYEENSNGLRIIGHGGDTIYFHSDLHLIPDKNLGFFVSYNSAGRGEISTRTALWQKFIDRYFPYKVPDIPKSNLNHAKDVTGYYLGSRRTDGDIVHLLWRLTELKVIANPDGTISVDEFKDFNGKVKKLREIKPFAFRETNGQELVVFHQPKDGAPMRLIVRFPFFVFDRVSFYESSRFLIILATFSLSVLALVLILWPVAGLVRRRYATKLELTPAEKRARLLTRIVCLLDLIFVIGLAIFISKGSDDVTIFSDKTDIWIRLLQVLGLFGLVGTLIAIYSAYRFWTNRQFGGWAKLIHAVIAIACIGYAWLVIQGHLLNFALRY
jgi:CubicO group peptidase (beta-lactamase class C family)